MPMRAAALAIILAATAGCGGAANADDAPKEKPPVKRENRLARERSPYLLQHKDNPVDWYPWGEEAFARAKREQKPIFLSVGYSSCHWCHVMEHESFEDAEVARLLNERFISVKVDREERPDVDEVYMRVTQMLTGHGGWPMSVFMTPDKRPFFAGTYFPKTARMGSIGFIGLLKKIDETWRTKRSDIERSASEIAEAAAGAGEIPDGPKGVTLPAALAKVVAAALERRFDEENGGFGGAPKFPPHQALRLLIEERERVGERGLHMALTTLEKMAAGGIHDHVGGGFARYSTDEAWHVPHFEKMLYDNAMLARSYVDANDATKKEAFADTARGIFGWVLREMTDAEGGFYSALDADSEGVEGKFYLWAPTEVAAILGEKDAKAFCTAYDITAAGNWEHGKSIPRLTLSGADPRAYADARARLYEVRRKRVWPGLDDKVLTSWNGLMIGAFARGGEVLKDERYRAAAERAARFLLSKARGPDGRLLRSWRKGEAGLMAYLDDHAFLADGLLDLHQATGSKEWLDAARGLGDRLLADYQDTAGGGFFFTAHDAEELLFRSKDPFDGALPAGNAVAARALVRLAKLTGEAKYQAAADRTLRAFAGALQKAPAGTLTLASALALRGDVPPGPVAAPAGGDAAAAPEPVAATLRIEGPDPVAPGGTFTAVIEIAIADPFHLAAPLEPPKLAGAFPLEVGAPRLPEPETAALGFEDAPAKVYRGRIRVEVPVKVKSHAAPGTGPVRAEIKVQACDDRRCLAPASVVAEAELRVGY